MARDDLSNMVGRMVQGLQLNALAAWLLAMVARGTAEK